MIRGKSWELFINLLASAKTANDTRTIHPHRRPRFCPTLTALESYQLLSLSTVASFSGTNGELPVGRMVLDGQGDLFGVTEFGGTAMQARCLRSPKGRAL